MAERLGDLAQALQAMKRAAALQLELDQYNRSQVLRELHEFADVVALASRVPSGAARPAHGGDAPARS